ncbi:MAG: DUF2851 family protein [Bacteroidales bacterium]
MKEEFLHFIWKYSLYNKEKLETSEGDLIEVLNPGEYNRDSGPDFFNARLKYRGLEWAGNVEIHTKASHFDIHGHSKDHAYDNVILHVVAENDRKVFTANGVEIPAAVISFDRDIYDRYLNLVNNPGTIACEEEIPNMDKFRMRHWISALVIERLCRKYEMIKKMLSETANDWEEVFYRMISRYFGFKVNTGPFEMLASALPFRIIRKHLDSRLKIEALLFGTAGMLSEGLFKSAVNDSYYMELIREFNVLKSKYSIRPLHGWLWKFSKLRPVNFPTVRISQLAAILAVTGGLFSRVTETRDIRNLRKIFNVSASEYWDNHYVFGKESRAEKKSTGDSAIDILLVNAIIPVLFTYGKVKDNNDYCMRAIDFLEDTAPEENRIIKEWKETGVDAYSAFETQGLLQLRNEYCRKRRCLDCRIGSELIARGIVLKKDEEIMLEPHEKNNNDDI